MQVYNGVSDDWFIEHDEYTEDGCDSELSCEKLIRFSRSEFPDVNTSNTYFSTLLGFPEAVFYALILSDLLKKKDLFIQSRKTLAEKEGELQRLHEEYYYFQAEEDIARITLFTKHILHTLYRFIGEEKYVTFISIFDEKKEFSSTCDLEKSTIYPLNMTKKNIHRMTQLPWCPICLRF